MYAKCGSIDKAFELFDKMPQRNVGSWNAMIVGYAQYEFVENARELFDRMPQRDVISRTAMIVGYAQNGFVEKAHKLCINVYKWRMRMEDSLKYALYLHIWFFLLLYAIKLLLPALLHRKRYREAADIIKKGKMCVLFINDLDVGAGRMGGTTKYIVKNQMVNATLMNIADNPTNVQLPDMYNKEDNPRVPIIVIGNDFSTLARVYGDDVTKWIGDLGVESIGKNLINSREGPPTFQKHAMTVEKLLEYGNMLVKEQENVKHVQLADKYIAKADIGEANEDAIKIGAFYGKATQQVNLPIPEGCTDPSAENYDPTTRNDDGT
ncbi:hypothetical protein KI387_025377, partial [Taxus chinensis]